MDRLSGKRARRSTGRCGLARPNKSKAFAIGSAAVAAIATAQSAQAAGPTTQFTVSGNVVAPRTFALADLQTQPAITLSNVTYLNGNTPVTGSFTGVGLWDLLNTTIGLRTNAAVKNDILNNVVIATGSDGYQSVISLGELNPSFGGSASRPDLVAYANNGQPLTSDGFARTVVPGDIRGGRYVSNLTSLQVVHAPTQTGAFSGGIASQFTVTGQVTAPATYTLAGLQALPTTSVAVSGTTYTGVSLWTLLNTVGITTNPTIKNNILDDYVVATGSDGYQTTIALGEISPLFGNQPDLVAYAMNGGSLGASGFARLIVPNDVLHGRWVSNLINLEVFDVTQWVANAGEQTDLTGLSINALGFHLNGGILTSSNGPGSLTVPTALLDGGVIAAGVTVASPNAIVQASGVSTIYGALTTPQVAINGGALALAGGRVNGSVSVNSGGALGGTGVVTGGLTFAAGSTFAVGVTPTTSNTITVNGAAALAGVAMVNPATSAAYRSGARYTLLTAAGGATGQFSSLSIANPFPLWVIPTLAYTGGELDLVLNAATLSSQITSPLSRNQASVVGAIDKLLLTNNAPQSFLNLFNIAPGALPTTLTSLSGEAMTGAETATLRAGSSFLNLLLDPNARADAEGRAATAPALAYADAPSPGVAGRAIGQVAPVPAPAPAPLWSVWASAFGGAGSTDGRAGDGSSRATNGFAGLAAGADYRPSADLVAGFGLAGGGTSFHVNGLGSGSSDLFQAGAFASKTFDNAYVSAAAAYTWVPITMTRNPPVGGAFDSLTAKPNSDSVGGRLEVGMRLAAWGLSPYAAVEAQSYRMGAATEASAFGPAGFPLAYASQSTNSVRSELGFRAEATIGMTAVGALVGYSRLAWAHEFDPARDITASFVAFPGAPFLTRGAAAAEDSALVTAGAELRLDSGWRVFAKADADLAPSAYEILGSLGARYTW